MDEMPLIRGHHSVDDHFSQIPNDYLRDGRLSLKARGLLGLLMSHKEGWSLSIQSLVTQNIEGKDAIRSAIEELEALGYLERYQVNEGGRFGEVIFKTKDPDAPLAGEPLAGEPLAENPLTENPPPKNTKEKKTNTKNTKDLRGDKLPYLLPEEWNPRAEDWDTMAEHFPWVDLKKQTYSFRDYWTSQPPSKAKKTDWDATWRNWIRRAADYNKPKEEPRTPKHRFTMED